MRVIAHSRWLTLATRILAKYILYTREATPSDSLKSLAEFVVRFYACAWFKTKHSNDMADMPAIYFEAIKVMLSLNLTRLDISAIGFWSPQELTMMDVRVFNLNSPSYIDKEPKSRRA